MIFSRNKKNMRQAFVYYGRIFSIILLFAIARGGTINGVLAQETEKTISVKLEDASVLEALQEINRLSGNMVTFRKEEVEKELTQRYLEQFPEYENTFKIYFVKPDDGARFITD